MNIDIRPDTKLHDDLFEFTCCAIAFEVSFHSFLVGG